MKKKIIRREVKASLTSDNLHPLLGRIYSARGITCVSELEHGLEKLLPFSSLLNINEAVQCLVDALQQQQRIIVVGDFDADGATSTALTVSALRAFGAKHVSYLVPNRFEYGYGLTPEIVAVAAKSQPELLITVDNGIASIAGVEAAKKFDIKVLITDHHLPGDELPQADAIINPNLPGDPFASKNLAGVGVIFYLMLALRSRLRSINWFVTQQLTEPNMAQFLDLVALGTVADVVTLDKNNRILVGQGLGRIRAGKMCPGILALLNVAGRNWQNMVAADLGFSVAPRLNAAGRLDDMSLGITCLLATDINQAQTLAVQLDALNRERQAIEADMQQQAQRALANLHLQNSLPVGVCLYDESWHQGVVGILAARIKDQVHRPVIAFAKVSETELKGSARSVPGLHIRDVLANVAVRHPQLITKFGGHAMAAGLSILYENFTAFQKAFAQAVADQLHHITELSGKIYSDGELAADEFDIRIAEMLRNAGPWGQGYEEPIFDGQFQIYEQRVVGQKHLKLKLGAKNSRIYDAIAFNVNLSDWPNHRCEKILAAYRLDINEYRGQRNLQLIIEHLEPVE